MGGRNVAGGAAVSGRADYPGIDVDGAVAGAEAGVGAGTVTAAG